MEMTEFGNKRTKIKWIKIKNIWKLKDYYDELYDEIEYCDWSWKCDKYPYCCFTLTGDRHAYVRLFQGNICEEDDVLSKYRMWLVKVEIEMEDESENETFYMIYLETLSPIVIHGSEDVEFLIGITPFSKW